MNTTASARRQGAFKVGPFGSWLKRTRESRRWSVAEFADRCAMSRSTIQDLEHGRSAAGKPMVDLFERLADGLEIDLGYVLSKAGYKLSADGLTAEHFERVQRLEDVLRVLDEEEHQVREAIAEAMRALEQVRLYFEAHSLTDERLSAGEAGYATVTDGLGRALGVLDLITTRLRARRSTA